MNNFINVDGIISMIVLYALNVIRIIKCNFEKVRSYLAVLIENNNKHFHRFL